LRVLTVQVFAKSSFENFGHSFFDPFLQISLSLFPQIHNHNIIATKELRAQKRQ
ncbi:hypothetical protein S83_065472, partial [Arachis hypogaea]